MGKRLPRIAGEQLQRIRRDWFFAHPLCVICLASKPKRVRLAMELDHIVPLHKGGKDEDSNRQGLCKPCHEQKTAQDMGHRERIAFAPDGELITP